MANSEKHTMQNTISRRTIALLLKEFYDLRKNFEASYSGKLRIHKYEETREFIISLSHALFEVNHLDIDETECSEKTQKLKVKLKKLRNDWNKLIRPN